MTHAQHIPGLPVYGVRQTTADAATLLQADAPAWDGAAVVSFGVSPYETHVRALWTSEGLAVRFDAADERPWHTMTRRDDHIWNEEVVEIFLDPDGSGRNYYELEVNPVNVVCDLVVPTPWPELHSNPTFDLAGLATRVKPWRGPGAGPDGWTALAWMPWSGFRPLPTAVALPPAPGTSWRANLYRIKRPFGPEKPAYGVVHAAWSPTGSPSFHVPTAFGRFVFEA